MAGIAKQKGHGLTFAEQQLKRHGWEEGKGLGRAENGITEAVKVKVKCNKGGVGHKEGEQFTFHWWDHVFNKASSSVQVDSDQNGVTVKRTTEEGEEDTISNKKPRQTLLAKAKLYGCFVKSATLRSGQEQPEPKSSHSSSSSSDEDDDQKLDLSSTTKLSDAELMKVCGGRTAHKGARHGLTMSAKLARLEQQEAEFMAKYDKRNKPAKQSTLPASQSAHQEVETDKNPACKKTKKKKSLDASIEVNGEVLPVEPEIHVKTKRKKKKKALKDTEETLDSVLIAQDDSILTNNDVTKKNKKKKTKVDEAPPQVVEPSDTKEKRKKKRKAEEHREASEEVVNSDAKKGGSESNQNSVSNPSRTSSSAGVIEEEENSAEQKSKKHKKKRDSAVDCVKQETFSPKKKKKKSKTKD